MFRQDAAADHFKGTVCQVKYKLLHFISAGRTWRVELYDGANWPVVSLLDFAPPQGAMMTIETYGSQILAEPDGKPPGSFSADNPNPPPAIICFLSTRKVNVFANMRTRLANIRPHDQCHPALCDPHAGLKRPGAGVDKRPIPPPIPTRDRSSVRKVLKSAHFRQIRTSATFEWSMAAHPTLVRQFP